MLFKFCEQMNSYYCQCVPLKTKKISYSRINKLWLTSELIHSIKLKSKYFKLYRSGRISKHLNNEMQNNVNEKFKNPKKIISKICLTCICQILKRAGLNFHYCYDVKTSDFYKRLRC